jgi:hypothetical protein
VLGQFTVIHTWMSRTRTASFVYGNVPSRLNKIHEWGVEILMLSIESSFVTLGSRFAGVRRLSLHPMVKYGYLILCPRILGISQLDYHFLRLLLIGYSNLKDFWSNALPSVSGVFLNGPPLWVSWTTAKTRDVCITLYGHSNVYGQLRTARNWVLAIVVLHKRMYKTMFGWSVKWRGNSNRTKQYKDLTTRKIKLRSS